VRAYTLDWQHWLDDHRHLLNLIAGGPNPVNSSTTATANTSDATRAAAATTADDGDDVSANSSYNLGLTPQQAERLAQVPIFISGESLGGGQSIALGLRLQKEVAAAAATSAATATVEAADATTDDDSAASSGAAVQSSSSADDRALQVAKRFAGVCLVAPAIRGNPPPKPVCWFLRYFIVPLIPQWSVPNMLESVAVPAAIWKKPEDMEACLQDSWETTPQVSAAAA
jgi:hypothetical protein